MGLGLRLGSCPVRIIVIVIASRATVSRAVASRAIVSRARLPGEEDEHISGRGVHVQLQHGGHRGLDVVGLRLGGVHELHRVGAPQDLHRRRAAEVAAEDLVTVKSGLGLGLGLMLGLGLELGLG